jgi:hypothetical protein
MPGSPRSPGPSPALHCPHCWGNCGGRCLIPGIGGCVHQGPKLPGQARLRLIRTRRFWRRVLFGVR